MDGLEAVEVKLSELERTHRIDSEFFKKENLQINIHLSHMEKQTIDDVFLVSDGNHMSISDCFTDAGIPYYRGQDIYNFFIETSSPAHISENVFEFPQMKRSHLKKGDILMSIVGAIIGNSSIVDTDAKATCSCKLAILRAKSFDIAPEILLIYIKSKYGQNQIQKYKRGAAQTGFLLEDFEQIHIPLFSACFQNAIIEIVNMIKVQIQNAISQYTAAESYLYDLINYDSTPKDICSISIRRKLDSFEVSGRLDAEYYQPKYGEIEKHLSTTETVASLCNISDKNFTPKSDTKYQYIELSNIGTSGEIGGVDCIMGSDLPTRARRLVKKGQVIVSSIEGSLSSCALIDKEYDGALCSTGFYVVDSDCINPETLLTLFKSVPIQALLKKRCSGAILAGITKGEFLSTPLPFIEESTQKSIKAKIEESFALRKKSAEMLEVAKTALEIAIEEGEEKALQWLTANIASLEG